MLQLSPSPLQRWVLAGAVPLLFVLPLYAAPRGSRDAPATVWSRIGVSSCAACGMLAAAHVLQPVPRLPLSQWVGLRVTPRGLGLTAALVCALYSGNMMQAAACAWPPRQQRSATHIRVRNLLASPIIEELVFRAAVYQILLPAGVAPATVALCSPAIFAAAHLHHMLRHVVHDGVPVQRAAARQAFQLLYTSLFGALASALYAASGSIMGPCMLHAICNWQGVPAVSGRWRHEGKTWRVFAAWAAGGAFAVFLMSHMLAAKACELAWCKV